MPVTQRTIVAAINTPGGIVYEWRDERAKEMIERGRATSPKNKSANARHRGGVTGTYLRMWRWERGRGSQTVLRAIIRNRANHATFVEFGRSISYKYQRFSWTQWGAQIRYIGQPPKGMNPKKLAFWIAAKRGGMAEIDPAKVPDPWGGRKTGARKGKHTLRNAINYVMVPWGFSRLS